MTHSGNVAELPMSILELLKSSATSTSTTFSLHDMCKLVVEAILHPCYKHQGFLYCLPPELNIECLPLDKPGIADSSMLRLVNALGSLEYDNIKFFSWLCTQSVSSGTRLVVLQKWKIFEQPVVIAFAVQPTADSKEVKPLYPMDNAPFTRLFSEIIAEQPGVLDNVNKSIILSLRSVLNLNSRLCSILNHGVDPLLEGATVTEVESMECSNTLPGLSCLPPECTLTLENSDYSLKLPDSYFISAGPLKTSHYTVWLCTDTFFHDFVIVKSSGIENVCSYVAVSLDFSSLSRTKDEYFHFAPFMHLTSEERAFVRDEFLNGETFCQKDPEFHILGACVHIVLSEPFQKLGVEPYLPATCYVHISEDMKTGEEMLSPSVYCAGPLSRETAEATVHGWLVQPDVAIVVVKNKSNNGSHYMTALAFEYNGQDVSNIHLANLPQGLKILATDKFLNDEAHFQLMGIFHLLFKTLCFELV